MITVMDQDLGPLVMTPGHDLWLNPMSHPLSHSDYFQKFSTYFKGAFSSFPTLLTPMTHHF